MGGIVALKFIAGHPDRVLSGTLGGIGWLPLGGGLKRFGRPLKFEWVGVLRSVPWAGQRRAKPSAAKPLTATTGPDNRALLNAGVVRHSAMEARVPVHAKPAV
jgi:hypothetical protein